MPLYSPGDNTINLLLQRLAGYNREVTTLPGAAANINNVLTYNGISYQSNGTNWLSLQVFPLTLIYRQDNTLASNSLSATRNNVLQAQHPDNASALYITTITNQVFVNLAQSTTNFWTINYRTRDITGGLTNTYTGNTKLGTTASRQVPVTVNVNAVVARASFYDILADYVLTAAGGTIAIGPATLWYRLVG